jgi:hypothetical protein
MISENAPAQTFVGAVIAKDFDFNQTLTYSIVSGNSNNAFTINPGTGVLSVNNPEALNFEETEYFTLVVSVQDNGQGNLTAFSTITVGLLDVNEAPIMDNQALSVVENSAPGTKIGYLKANDPDKGQKVKFMIVGGNESHAFNLSDTTGLISVADPSKLSYGHNPLFALTVMAQDNGTDPLSALSVITINLLRDTSGIIMSQQEFSPVADASNEKDISVYPNPTRDIININLEKFENQPIEIQIFSITGSQVYSAAVSKGDKKVIVDMGKEHPGTYMARIKADNQFYTKSIVVQN